MKFIPNRISRSVGRKVLTTKKNSPHIFFVGGILGVVGSTVMACRATLKLEKSLDEIKTEFNDVKTLHKDSEKFSEQDYYRDLGYVYTKSAVKLGKLYGPAMVVGTVSIGALTGSHVQLTRRNTTLTLTLAAVSKAYDEYRIRVQEELGARRELELYRDIRDESVDNKGKKQIAKVVGPNGHSPYARIFDESNVNWQKDSEMNRIFIQCQQSYANHLLNSRGHVFLNEVYDQLGMDRTPAGQVVGWVRDNDQGDGYIDFNLYENDNKAFALGWERSIWLDFNVDGVVYEMI